MFSSRFFALLLAILAAGAVRADSLPAGTKWAASWATSVQGAIGLDGLPFAPPMAAQDGLGEQSLRMIIRPDLWGHRVRLHFSNHFGTRPLTIGSASVALQRDGAELVAGSAVALRFGGQSAVTIAAGQELYSDPVDLRFVTEDGVPRLRGRNLAVSLALPGRTGPLSGHEMAQVTSYVSAAGAGDVTEDETGLSFPFETQSFLVVDALDVVAPADTQVIAAFGDSVTDGFALTINGHDRWVDSLSRQLHARHGEHVSVINAGISGNAVAAPVVGPPAIDRIARDLLGLSGLTLVIWEEGANDLAAAKLPPDRVIAGYRQGVAALHAAGLRVIGGTIPPTGTPNGKVPPKSPFADEPALANAFVSKAFDKQRRQLNDRILTGTLFDGVIDFSAAVSDGMAGMLRPEFAVKNDGEPGDHIHPNRAGQQAIGMAAVPVVEGMLAAPAVIPARD